MLTEGDPAPDFDLPRPATGGDQTYRLSAAAREGPVVVAFYPLADVDGAADLLTALAGADWAGAGRLAAFGVGVGERADHERLVDRTDVGFPLLLDRDGYFADRYGLLEPAGEGAVRMAPAVYLVDGDCVVRFARQLDAGESPPVEAIRDALASL
ncbi:redoxin domain-containing protein [Halomicrobium salinisoli]|uniref:redoxin domain-containing protein n=1 Tax=Halomicrobium salinisoli TaxID=2878391 RepID=UPI001CEFC72E|nr:redoxin domain-containing protein [Halomicrobium salinisoli]